MFKRGRCVLNKRGISPLIATVLLIAFAVSIGTMIMNWGRDVVASAGDCTDVLLEVQKLNENPVFCYDTLNSNIVAMIKNTGNVDIENMKLRVILPDLTVEERDVAESTIAVGDVKPLNVNYVRGGKFHVEFIPYIKNAGQTKACAAKSVAADDIPACNR